MGRYWIAGDVRHSYRLDVYWAGQPFVLHEPEERIVRTIAIVNQKGGCGKTTTAINLGGVFAGAGYKTLLVDMDPQGHCAAGLAIPDQRIDVQIGDAMLAVAQHRAFDHDRLLWRVSRNLDLAPSTMKLAGLEASRGDFAGQPGAETRLTRVLHQLGSSHDICLIDCSPAIGMLAFNALVAADEVLIPVETGFFSLQGATKQVNTIKALGKRLGASPTYRLLATLHNDESIMAVELLEELRRRFGAKLIPQPIRFDQRLRESASFGQAIVEYAPDSPGSSDYRTLARWLLDNKPAARRDCEPATSTDDSGSMVFSASTLMSEIADEMLSAGRTTNVVVSSNLSTQSSVALSA